jgi:hypothetical protein
MMVRTPSVISTSQEDRCKNDYQFEANQVNARGALHTLDIVDDGDSACSTRKTAWNHGERYYYTLPGHAAGMHLC